MSVQFKNLSPETRALLNERYGKQGGKGWKSVAIVISSIALPWLLWTAWHHSNPDFSATTVKYITKDDKTISLTFDLSRKDSTDASTCTLIALDIDKNVVGEADLIVPPSDLSRLRITTTITTRLRAVNASVERCWKTADAPTNLGK